MKHIFAFFFIFFIIFRIKISYIDLTPLLFIVSLVYSVLLRLKIERWFCVFVSLYCVYFIYRLSVVLINSSIEINAEFILRDIRFLMSAFISYIAALTLFRMYGDERKTHYLIYSVLFLQPLVMFVQLLSPEVRYLSTIYLPFDDNYHAFRVNGLMNGYVPAGNFLGIISLYSFYLYHAYKKHIFIYMPFSFLILFPISGLSGLSAFLIGFVVFIFLKSNFKDKILSLIIIFILLVCAIVMYPYIVSNNPDLSKGFDRILVLFGKNESDVNATVDGSFDVLMNTYALPDGVINFIIGNAQQTKSLYATTTSDAGIISTIHEFGILAYIFMFAPLFYIINRAKSLFVLMLFGAFFIVFLKINFFYSRIAFDFFMLVTFLSIFFRKQQEKG
ncbi:hypothetical protein [Aeromonas caviae]|uniref:hypothetical protein n=1 Tax=Aeromonas caviae TaxID=648 RepID=UPI00244718C5|nr:hypothetical protein [Aeromonas caviae]MDH1635328.1 hypothetical protein [Aeromonas caviae]